MNNVTVTSRKVKTIRIEARRHGRMQESDWFDAGLAPMPTLHGERFLNQNKNHLTFEYRIVPSITVRQN